MKQAKQDALNALDLPDRETLVRCFQKEHGLVVDGWPGAVTMEVIGNVQGDPEPKTMREVVFEAFEIPCSEEPRRVTRAKFASTIQGTKYKLGRGGVDPSDRYPSSGEMCDCSGLASWVMGLPRKHDFGRYHWINTDAMLADSRGHQDLFLPLEDPVPGCFVVYGRSGNTPGHVALVTSLDPLTGIDCSSSVSKRTGSAISERNIEFFLKRDHQFMVPKE